MMLRIALSALLISSAPAAAEQLSILCDRDAYHFFTLDTDTHRAVLETPGGGVHKGSVVSISETEITLLFGGHRVYWTRTEGRIVTGPSKTDVLENCFPAPTRSILSKWDALDRWWRE